MASLTKEQLKNELISHGVQPPVQSARKEEFVKLYEQHVAPIVAQKGDFSSDEETEAISEIKAEVSNTSLVFNGMDITSITDEDLFSQLQSFGVPVGPIVDTTRAVYQRKLAALLQNGSAQVIEGTEHTNGNGEVHEEKFSDSEEEEQVDQKENDHKPEVELEPFEPSNAPVLTVDPTIVATPEPLTAIRKRMIDRPQSSLSALPLVDRQGTPTPRPSIHSLTSSTQYNYESRRLLDTTDSSKVKQLPSKAGSSPNKPKFTLYIVSLLIILATAYFIYTYASINQIKQLVENVRQNVFQYLEKAEQVAEKMDNAKPNPMPDV